MSLDVAIKIFITVFPFWFSLYLWRTVGEIRDGKRKTKPTMFFSELFLRRHGWNIRWYPFAFRWSRYNQYKIYSHPDHPDWGSGDVQWAMKMQKDRQIPDIVPDYEALGNITWPEYEQTMKLDEEEMERKKND